MKKLILNIILVSVLGFTIIQVSQPKIPTPPKKYPSGELGKLVELGEEIIMHTNTNKLTKNLVGNDLTCTNCHLDGGRSKTLGTFIGTAASFPAYSPREKTVQTLQDRINNCFMRSMNGKRPIIDTRASIAMVAYITWLSEGVPIKMNPKKPVNNFYSKYWINKNTIPLIKKATHRNYLNGKKLYQEKCADCHGNDGQGYEDNPPVWGNRSFNCGAGLAHPHKLATWLLANMPLDDANLSVNEAVDIAIYIDAQVRPDFNLQDHLFKREKMGYYNSKVLKEVHTVRSNFARPFKLNIDKIRGDNLIK